MAGDQLFKPKVLSHEKLHFETQISGTGGNSGDCDDGGWSGGGGPIFCCPCLGIVTDFAKIKGLPGSKDIIQTIDSFGHMLLQTSEGRFLLKRLYDLGPKITNNQDKEKVVQSIVNGVKLFQNGKLEEAKSFINKELTKLEVSTV